MKRGTGVVILCCLVMVGWKLASAQQGIKTDQRIADVVQSGKLRIGVFPSFQYSKDATSSKPKGLAIGIANAIAARMGIKEVVVVEHPTPPQVIACVKAGDCDIGFMLIDPARAEEVDFTPAFVRSDFTYLVPATSTLRSAADVDRPGIRIAVVRGHASTISLLRIIKQAQPVYADTYDPTFELLRSGQADAFASIREMLIQYSAQLPGSRVLEDNYQSNLAGIAVPKGKAGHLTYFSEALDEMKRSGSLKKLVEQNELRGVDVVPPK
jgi:polar amino acid transport system substrate-binding protein